MQIAHNPETGEYLGMQGGQWQKLTVAANDKGERLYLGPDGWLPLSAASAATPNSPAQEGGAGRSLGLGTRNVLEGLGGLAGSVVNPIANTIDRATGGSGTRFQNPGATLSNILGLPTAQNGAERLAGAVIEGGAGALPTLGAGIAMQGARTLPASAQAIGKILADMPRLQMASGLSGGGAMGAAQEGGAEAGGQMAAALAGGVLPGAIGIAGNTAGRALRSTAGALDRLTVSGQERLAGTALERMATDSARVRQLAEQGGGVLVEGSLPTTAQLTADSGLAVMEKALQSTPGGGAIRGRYTSQQDAQREALNSLLNPIQARQQTAIADVPEQLRATAPYGANLDERMAGQMMRGAFDEEYGNMRRTVSDAYQRIDPDGSAYFDLRPLVEGFEQSIGGGRYQHVPSEIRGVLNQMQDDISNGVNVSYKDLQDVRTMITDMAQSAAASGNAPVRRMAGLMKQNVDEYLERLSMTPELIGGSPTPQPGSAAYRGGTAAAREAMQSDGWFQDLDYLMQSGLNREAVERIVGKAGAEELNSFTGGALVRKNGKLMPDTAAADLQSFEGLIRDTGGGSYHADADAFLQSLMQRLGSMYGRKKQAMGNIRQDIMQDGAVPHTGFSPEQAAAFREAKALRRLQGERFEQGANEPLTRRGERLGGQAITDSSIPGSYFRPGGIGSESMEAFQRSMGAQPAANSAIADRAIATALRESTGVNGELDPRKLAAWMEQYRPALSQLDNMAVENALQQALETQQANFTARGALKNVARVDPAGNWELVKRNRQFPALSENAGFAADEAARFTASQADLKRVLDTHNMAAVNGSPTAQLQRVMDDLGRFKSGTMGGGGVGRNLLNEIISGVTKNADDKIEGMLIESVLDPEYAAKLMRNTNNMPGEGWIDSVRRWSGRGQQESFADMLARMGIATTVSAGRTMMQAKEDRK